MKKFFVLTAISLVFLVGCGQKGPLYIPGTVTDPNWTPPAEEEKDADEESEESASEG